MPFIIKKNRNSETYKVTNKLTGEVYAFATKNPRALIAAVELAKIKNAKIKKKK